MQHVTFHVFIDHGLDFTKNGWEGEIGIRWRLPTTKLDDLDFADDIALLSSTKHHIKEKRARLDGEARRVGLKINWDKTKMMRINPKQQGPIIINDKEIEDVGEFTYLGTKVCREGGGMKDLRNRLSKARSAYIRLKRIWTLKKIIKRTKIKLYRTLVIPVLLYGCETWKMNKKDGKMLDVFQQKCLRRILKIRWEDHVTNEEVQKRADMEQLSCEVKRRRWKIIGDVLRKDRENECNVALTWTPEGKRKRGRPKTTWRRTVEKKRGEAGWRTWEEMRSRAKNRERWKSDVRVLCATRHEEDW